VSPELWEIAGVSFRTASVQPACSLEGQVGLHFGGGARSVVSILEVGSSKGA